MSQARLHIDEIINEDFKSEYSVAKNGGEIVGNPTINNGLVSDGSGDGVSYPGVKWRGMQSFTFFAKIKSSNSFSSKALLGTVVGANGPLLRHTSPTIMTFWNDTGATSRSITHAELQTNKPYTVSVSYDDSTQSPVLFVNGVKSTASPLPQRINDNGSVEVGVRSSSLDSFDGELEGFSLYNRVLTDEEHIELHNGDELSYENNIKVNLPLDNYLGSERPFYTEETISGDRALLGDGVSHAVEPVKLNGVSGYLFDGADRIRVPSHPNNQFEGAFSLMLIVAGQMPAANRGILTKNVNSEVLTSHANTVYELSYLHSAGLIYFQRGDGVTKTALSTPVENIFDGNVHILFATYDGTTNADGMKLYRDNGEFLSSATAARAGQQVTSDDLMIGWATLNGVEGNIHAFKAFDKALTVTDMKDIYSNLTNFLHN